MAQNRVNLFLSMLLYIRVQDHREDERLERGCRLKRNVKVNYIRFQGELGLQSRYQLNKQGSLR